MCDVLGNIRLRMWVDPCGQVVSFAAGSDTHNKSEQRNIALRIVKFTVSLNSRLNRFSFTLNVTDACQVMRMSTGALR